MSLRSGRVPANKFNSVEFHEDASEERPLPESKRVCHDRGSAEAAAAISTPALLDPFHPSSVALPPLTTQSGMGTSLGCVPSNQSTSHSDVAVALPIGAGSQPWSVPDSPIVGPGSVGVSVGAHLALQHRHERALQDSLNKARESVRVLEARCAELEQVRSTATNCFIYFIFLCLCLDLPLTLVSHKQNALRHSRTVAAFERYHDGVVSHLGEYTSPSLMPLTTCLQLERLAPTSWLSHVPLDIINGVVRFVQSPTLCVAGGAGLYGTPEPNLYLYQTATKQWSKSHSPLARARYYAGCAVVDGQFVMTGGDISLHETIPSDLVECYSPARNKWSSVAPLCFSRSSHGAASVRNSLFVIGGQGALEPERVATGLVLDISTFVEVWNPAQDRWSFARAMNTPRRYFSCVAGGTDIYCCGGWDGKRRTSTCERYDAVADRWIDFTPMHDGINCTSGTLVDENVIHVLGGWNGTATSAANRHFDIRESIWANLAPMNAPRKDPSAISLDSTLRVLGGVTENHPEKALRIVEEYDARADKWLIDHRMALPADLYACSAAWLPSPTLAR